MAYTDFSSLKLYLGNSTTADDVLLGFLIDRAQAAVDQYTHRLFEATADTTRYFTVGKDTWGRDLIFDKDICSITTVKTNADNGTGGTTITSTYYTTMPRNETPYYGIRLLNSANYQWEYTNDPEAGISVAGRWAYSLTAPDDIIQATTRWAGYMYRQKDAQVFDVTAIPDAGVIQIPQGIPADVKALLDPYVLRVQR